MIENKDLLEGIRRGRPEVFEDPRSYAKLIEFYRESRSMRKTAEHFKVALRTVFKYVNRANASYPMGTLPAEDPLECTNNRRIAKDLDALQKPLPRSAVEILRLLGPKYNISAVQYFLASRQKAAMEVLNRYGSLLERTEVVLRDIYGRQIQVGSFAQYQLNVDRYNLNVTIEATLKFGGKVICRMSFQQFRELLKGIKSNEADQMPPK